MRTNNNAPIRGDEMTTFDHKMFQETPFASQNTVIEDNESDSICDANILCEHCATPIPFCHRDKRFCNNTCINAAWRRRKTLERLGIVESPRCLHGSFQPYATTFRKKIDVIITDPPYGREFLPVYKDLATFA